MDANAIHQIEVEVEQWRLGVVVEDEEEDCYHPGGLWVLQFSRHSGQCSWVRLFSEASLPEGGLFRKHNFLVVLVWDYCCSTTIVRGSRYRLRTEGDHHLSKPISNSTLAETMMYVDISDLSLLHCVSGRKSLGFLLAATATFKGNSVERGRKQAWDDGLESFITGAKSLKIGSICPDFCRLAAMVHPSSTIADLDEQFFSPDSRRLKFEFYVKHVLLATTWGLKFHILFLVYPSILSPLLAPIWTEEALVIQCFFFSSCFVKMTRQITVWKARHHPAYLFYFGFGFSLVLLPAM